MKQTDCLKKQFSLNSLHTGVYSEAGQVISLLILQIPKNLFHKGCKSCWKVPLSRNEVFFYH